MMVYALTLLPNSDLPIYRVRPKCREKRILVEEGKTKTIDPLPSYLRVNLKPVFDRLFLPYFLG